MKFWEDLFSSENLCFESALNRSGTRPIKSIPTKKKKKKKVRKKEKENSCQLKNTEIVQVLCKNIDKDN